MRMSKKSYMNQQHLLLMKIQTNPTSYSKYPGTFSSTAYPQGFV